MNRRSHLVDTVQALAREEAHRQPSAAAWLEAQDARARPDSAPSQPSHGEDAPALDDAPGPDVAGDGLPRG